MNSGATARSAMAGFSLESLTRGQRYTAAIALAFAVALVTVGGPDGTDDEVAAFSGGTVEPTATAPAAGVGAAAPATASTPPEPTFVQPVTFTTTPSETTTNTTPPSDSGSQPAPAGPQPAPADDQQNPPPEQPSPLQPVLDLVGG